MSDFSQSISDAFLPILRVFSSAWHSETTWLVVWDCPGTLLWCRSPGQGTGQRDTMGPQSIWCPPWIVSVIFFDQTPDCRFDLVLTNPPFGFLGGLACDILNHATKFTDRVAIIIFKCFRKVQRIDRINPNFHPVGDFNLPNETYILPDGTEKYVPDLFQMWERRDYKRKIFGNTPYTEFFRQVPFEEAILSTRTGFNQENRSLRVWFSLRQVRFTTVTLGGSWRVGRISSSSTIGRRLRGSPLVPRPSDFMTLTGDWRSPNTEKYLVHGILYDLMNGVYDGLEPLMAENAFLGIFNWWNC